MGRVITAERKEQIARAHVRNPDALGPVLGELVIDTNSPVEGIAWMLAVSEPTVYRWMYGMSEPRDAIKIKMIKSLLTILRKAKRAKDTPLTGTTKERLKQLEAIVRKHRRIPGPTA